MSESHYKISKKNNVLSVNFRSSIDNVEEVISMTRTFIEEKKREDSIDFFSLRLILLESLTNAVKHGNLLDTQKNIQYTFVLQDDCVEIDIQDMGRGFDWKETINSDIPYLSSSGRGIHIIKEYASAFRYNRKGNHLKIVINLLP